MKKVILLFIITVLVFACSAPIPDAPQFVCYYYHYADTIQQSNGMEEQRLQIYRDIECPLPTNTIWSRIHDSIFAFVLDDTTNYSIKNLTILSDYPHFVVKDTESTYSHQHNDYASLRTYYLSDSLYGYYCHTKWFDMGNHGTEGYYYRYYNTITGDQLTIVDLLSDVSSLTNYLDSHIRQSDKAWGILADTIRPNDNFIITDEGLTFVYNQYEIACYAVDTIKCFVPLAEFHSFIKDKYLYIW